MSWSYGGDPDGEPKDEVRFMVGDTVQATALTTDEEIEYILTMYPKVEGKPPWLAAAHVCDAIAGRFARKMQQTLGPLSASNQQQWEHYRQMAQDFRILHATNGSGIIDGSLAGTKPAAPVLGGGGTTYLGGTPYTTYGNGMGY